MDYLHQLERVANQFQAFLNGYSFLLPEDRQDILIILRGAATVTGDINTLLGEFPALLASASWFHHKYNVKQQELARVASRSYGEKYVSLRERGFQEWTAKSMAETDSTVVRAQDAVDQVSAVVGYLDSLVKVVRARLTVLEHISHNQRAEVKADRVS